MNIQFLQAFNGDCILVNFEDPNGQHRNILIDGGVGKCYFEKGKKKTVYNDLFYAVENIR